jgi:hypothetical protein
VRAATEGCPDQGMPQLQVDMILSPSPQF